MRRRQLKKLWARLAELQRMAPARDTLLLKLALPKANIRRLGDSLKSRSHKTGLWASGCAKTNCAKSAVVKVAIFYAPTSAQDPPKSGKLYILLTQIEEAFKTLKGDLAVRPIFHREEERIEAHIFVAFLAFVSTLPCVKSCGSKPRVSPRAQFSSSSVPCKCSMSTSRLPMDAP